MYVVNLHAWKRVTFGFSIATHQPHIFSLTIHEVDSVCSRKENHSECAKLYVYRILSFQHVTEI